MPSRAKLWLTAWLLVFAAWVWALGFVLEPVPHAGWILLFTYFIADAGSYLFHYVVDHYGDPARAGLVRDFQCHHLTPCGIAERPLCEVLCPAARIVTPVMLLLWPVVVAGWLPGWLVLAGWALGSLWVFTQLFHRWAHMPQTRGAVRWLQRLRLVVGPVEHARHHRAPYDSNFAVINGWSNWLFDRIGVPALLDGLLAGLGIHKRTLGDSLERLRRIESAGEGPG